MDEDQDANRAHEREPLSLGMPVITSGDAKGYRYIGRIIETAGSLVTIEFAAFDGSPLQDPRPCRFSQTDIRSLESFGSALTLEPGGTAFRQGPAGNVLQYELVHAPRVVPEATQELRAENKWTVRLFLSDGNRVEGITTTADPRELRTPAEVAFALHQRTSE